MSSTVLCVFIYIFFADFDVHFFCIDFDTCDSAAVLDESVPVRVPARSTFFACGCPSCEY